MSVLASRDVLRQIVQSQMWTSPFRHIPSLKNQRYHSNLLSQIKSMDDVDGESNDEDDDDDEDEMLCDEWIELVDLKQQCDELFDILYSTISGKKNSSVLLFGRNGFGKSALLSSVMQRMQKKCGKNAYIYIYLNAHLQTTDIESLNEIVSELKHQKNQNQIKQKKAGFIDDLEFLVNELKKVSSESRNQRRPIYIVLDNFELFAKRKKQTLLYNLFDLHNLNIIGMTNKKSVYEELEKRIRSRFVVKKIFVPSNTFLSESSFSLFYKIMYNALTIRHFKRREIKKYNEWIMHSILDNSEMDAYFRKLHRFGYSPSKFLVIAGIMSSMIFDEKYYLKRANQYFIKAIIERIDKELFADPFLRMLNDLSINELIVLIVAAKFDMTKDESFNFEIIYQKIRYVQMQDSMMITMQKHIYFECYRRLIKMKFLEPINNKKSKIFHTNFDMVRLNTSIDSGDIILRYIARNIKNLPSWINSWLLNNKTHICA